MPSRLQPPLLGKYEIVCPYCEAQNLTMLSGDHNETQCLSCSKDFHVFIATVRAKRGRTKTSGEYVIRAITHSGENVLRFMDWGGSDLDLRSRDIMYVCYKIDKNGVCDKQPSILGNATTHQFIKIKYDTTPALLKMLRGIK